ncbi:MAG: hypothetical protein LBL94_06750 [Prevotellaceae bacterium]|jgi:hypothetical protein|nr:hypothetical protein [Prevotellaceae bacterium]
MQEETNTNNPYPCNPYFDELIVTQEAIRQTLGLPAYEATVVALQYINNRNTREAWEEIAMILSDLNELLEKK